MSNPVRATPTYQRSTILVMKVDPEMNLIKSEENTKESPGTQLSISGFGITVDSGIGGSTRLSAAATSVIAKWGLDKCAWLIVDVTLCYVLGFVLLSEIV